MRYCNSHSSRKMNLLHLPRNLATKIRQITLRAHQIPSELGLKTLEPAPLINEIVQAVEVKEQS